jgi:hypothetical protein
MSDNPTEVVGTTTPMFANSSASIRGLRLWPGVVIVGLYWILVYGAATLAPGTFVQFMVMFWGPILAAVAFLGWWMFASRIAWRVGSRMNRPVPTESTSNVPASM